MIRFATLAMIAALVSAPVVLTTSAGAHPGHAGEANTGEANTGEAHAVGSHRKEAAPPITVDVPEQPGSDTEKRPWTSLKALDAEARFHFVVVSDRTGNHRKGIWQQAMDKIDLMQPAFVVSVGDLIEGYTEDRRQLTREWEEIDAMIGTLDAPFFYVSGNHDYSNQVMADVWAERLGASYYSFKYKGALFVVLNSALFDREGIEGYGKRGGDWAADQAAQLAWLDQTLTANEDARWTFMFMHRPYWLENWVKPPVDEATGERPKLPATGPWETHKERPPEWFKVEEMLGDRPYTFFAGHEHIYEYDETPGVPHQHRIRLASTGGASGLRGIDYGSFDHFVWVTMTEKGPVIANVLLDGVLPKDFEMKYRRPWFAPRDPSDPLAKSEDE